MPEYTAQAAAVRFALQEFVDCIVEPIETTPYGHCFLAALRIISLKIGDKPVSTFGVVRVNGSPMWQGNKPVFNTSPIP